MMQPPPQRKADEYAATMLYKRPVTWELRVVEGPQASIVYRLKPLTTIGRASDNIIAVDDPMASRHHTRLEWMGDNYLAIDLGSSNGTFVNEQRISAAVILEEGDLLVVGQTRFVVQKRES
jgi:pSer/pThr/pTyr-binding forkhead associated (FHA) protein